MECQGSRTHRRNLEPGIACQLEKTENLIPLGMSRLSFHSHFRNKAELTGEEPGAKAAGLLYQ